MKSLLGNLAIANDTNIILTFQVKKLKLLLQFSTNKNKFHLDEIPFNTPIQLLRSDKIKKVSYNSSYTVKIGNFFGLINEKNELFTLTFNSNIIKNDWKIYLNMQKEPYGYFLVRT